ncbi:MAG: hypothetical protein J6L85_01630 [Clostridia bacterium]|nr:hypothetical protein [Clostridia bacterium]
MILRNIKISELGVVDILSCELCGHTDTVRVCATEELSYAIALVLNSKALPFLPCSCIGEKTRIEASVYADQKEYRLLALPDVERGRMKLYAYNSVGDDVTNEYLRISSHCEEQDMSELFDGKEKMCFLRLLRYANEEMFYERGDLSRRTDGMSELRAFRAYLRAFIRDFRPERIRDGKKYEIVLKRNGAYSIQCEGREYMSVYLSETEQKLFSYLCFLRTVEFWSGFEDLRNFNGVKKPLIIRNFLERLDESVDTDALIRRASELGRQVIVISR